MTDPLLSVIMPTCNRRDDLERAARSVLGQDLCDLELVVVDDASTDGTAEVLDRLGCDRRVRVIRNDRSLGECGARNRGLEQARGELVAFCDDDDAWLPGAASSLAAALTEDPRLGGATSWYEVFHVQEGRSVLFRGPLGFGAEQMLWQNLMTVFGMFRRSAFELDPRFDPEMPTAGDWDFWLRIALERPIAVLPRALYRYRQHGASRATGARSRQVQGRSRLLAKHGSRMTEACRLYHRAVIAGYSGGRAATAKTLLAAGAGRAGAALGASSVLATSLLTSKLGTRLGDPGLQARVTARMVGGRRHDDARSWDGAGR